MRSAVIGDRILSPWSSRRGRISLTRGHPIRVQAAPICSALNLFVGLTKAPFQAHILTLLGPKKAGQINDRTRRIDWRRYRVG